MKLTVCNDLPSLSAASWDRLVGDACPFLEWGWLASLEQSGTVAPETGWLPQHLTLWDRGELIGACPLYGKSHSQGEFVFDHGWAEAAERAGIRYYPKLLAAVPFTPATGARFLVHPDADRPAVTRVLVAALRDMCHRPFSSVHVNFCLPQEAELLSAVGFAARAGYQFHWINPGWRTFDDYLSGFRSKRRIQIKRERRELAAQGIEIVAYAGDAIPDALFRPMFELYTSTIEKFYWGRQYLNFQLFELLRERWKHRLCFLVARRAGRVVAGAFAVRKKDVLYGRYWGTFEELRYLHFNVCYYSGIAYCLEQGIRRFEPGAGGEFKYLRGFTPSLTHSMHLISDPRLDRAVRDYLEREREAVGQEIEWLDARSPLKKDC